MNVSERPGELHRFDELCRTVTARGRGISLSELGDAAALAREELSPRPNAIKLQTLRTRLGLDHEETP